MSLFTFVPRPSVVIGVPLETTEVERKAIEDAALSAGARKVHLVENPLPCRSWGAASAVRGGWDDGRRYWRRNDRDRRHVALQVL